MKRSQTLLIQKDLSAKMVFVVGPRQVGKTWLTKHIAQTYKGHTYLNHDVLDHRSVIKDQSWSKNTPLLIFDELHKMNHWKNYLKGVFDGKQKGQHILVTGSARLDIFRNIGDSLAGRFFSHRLLPLSLKESRQTQKDTTLERLISRGGFPEPFLATNVSDSNRWRLNYIDGLIRDDILDFHNVRDLKGLQQVFKILQQRVGSTISYANIARDTELSPITIKKYITLLESLFIVFQVRPYSHKISRSLLKEPKVYFFDTGLVFERGGGEKLENSIAVSLLKNQWFLEDSLGISHSLHYMQTKEKKEVDFALSKNEQLIQLIEVKTSQNSLSKNLRYFSEKYDIPGVQVVKHLDVNQEVTKTLTKQRADDFLMNLAI